MAHKLAKRPVQLMGLVGDIFLVELGHRVYTPDNIGVLGDASLSLGVGSTIEQ